MFLHGLTLPVKFTGSQALPPQTHHLGRLERRRAHRLSRKISRIFKVLVFFCRGLTEAFFSRFNGDSSTGFPHGIPDCRRLPRLPPAYSQRSKRGQRSLFL